MLSRLTCEQCGHRPYSPPSRHGEVRRVRGADGRARLTFLCEECSGLEPRRPLGGLQGELALHLLLLAARRGGETVDAAERREIERNTLKAFHR